MGKKESRLVKSSINKRELREALVAFLKRNPGRSLQLKNIFSEMGLTKTPLRMLCVDLLNEMHDAGDIVKNHDGNLVYRGSAHVVEGVFNRTSGGRNYVDTDDGLGISIYDEDTHHALPGDRVKVGIHAKKYGHHKLHGEVVEIVKRREKPFVGTLDMQHSVAFLTVPSGILQSDIIIPVEKLKGAKNGQKVVVKVTDWPMGSRNPVGEVVDVLGKEGENNAEMHAILAEYGLPYKYQRKWKKLPTNSMQASRPKRLRSVRTSATPSPSPLTRAMQRTSMMPSPSRNSRKDFGRWAYTLPM